MALILKDYLEKVTDPKEIKRILRAHSWANPPSTNEYHFRIYDPETELVHGSLIEEDGDHKSWGPKKLDEVLRFFAIDTLQRHPTDRRENPFVGALPMDW